MLRTLATLAIVTLVAGLALPGEPAGAAPLGGDAVSATVPSLPTVGTVTLVTGDRVTVRMNPDGSLVGDVQAAPGRSDVAFVQQSGPGSLAVIPSDAMPLINSGQVDQRLFDVAYLLDNGYGDESVDVVPLIATYGIAPMAATMATQAGVARTRVLAPVNGEALEVRKSQAATFWDSLDGSRVRTTAVRKLWLDAKVTAALDVSVPQIGAPAAWDAGYTGAGVTVAVLDTGYDPTHPDLQEVVTDAQDFTGQSAAAIDGHGHGTHVASIIAGRGSASGGTYTGVAKDANLVVGKVLADDGVGQWSWVIAGMEWAAYNTPAKVINVSLGGEDTPGVDPVEQTVNQLSEQTGKLFVISAGNTGPNPQTVWTPGSADAALTVAAVDANDSLAAFSGRGPRMGDMAVKPDIAAPGVGIGAARATGTTMPGSTPIDDHYTRASGTSQAAPHVAGVAALVTGQRPGVDADELKALLTSTSVGLPGGLPYGVGAGRVDATHAVDAQVYATRSSVSFGYLRWPYDDAEPVSQTISFRNDSTDPVTLDLDLDVFDRDGAPADPDTFTVSTSQLSVPAGSTAEVVVTFAAGDGDPGVYGGYLTAESTDGQHRARVALGAVKEPESYDVTVNALNRDGEIPGEGTLFNNVIFFNYETGDFVVQQSGDTARLPVGTYAINAYVSTARAGNPFPAVAQMSYPELHVDQDMTVTLDSRQAQRLSFTIDDRPQATVQYRYQHMMVKYPDDESVSYFSWTMGTTPIFDEVYVSAANTSDKFAFATQARLKDEDGNAYNLTFPSYYEVPDVDYHVTTRELARVDTTYRGLGGPSRFSIGALPAYFDRYLFKLSEIITVPDSHAEYFTAGVPFHQTVEPLAWTTLQTLRPGQVRTETFAAGVIGPWLQTPPPPTFQGYGEPRSHWAYRDGNIIDVRIPMLTDATGEHLPAMQSSLPIPGYARLYLDGALVGESTQPAWGRFAVPAAEGDYRLEAFLACNTQFCAVSNPTAHSVWTFRSQTTDRAAPLPLMTVRYLPELDEHNMTSADTITFPVYVDHQPGSVRPGKGHRLIEQLSIEASFDDGATWHAVDVHRHGNHWNATVHNPDSGQVSLKATAVDRYGNTVEQTVWRAYGVSP